jgi:hypothetical protein
MTFAISRAAVHRALQPVDGGDAVKDARRRRRDRTPRACGSGDMPRTCRASATKRSTILVE